MISKDLIASLAGAYLEEHGLKLVRVKVSKENDISIYIARKGGVVSIDDCANLSRHIESELDRDKEDFSLMVSSAGTGYRDEEDEEEA